MTSLIECLPNEPRLSNVEQQTQLTTDYLESFAKEVEQLFIRLRRELDSSLRQSKPEKLGKPYPLGQCLEISQAMWHALKQVDQSALTQKEAQGYQAFVRFIQAGGELKQVWGDLRGQYFQNAFLLGSWYLDVANDTVDVNKCPVEIMPFEQSELVPIKDFFHFSEVARQYWQAIVLPNVLVPSLAQYFPIIVLQPNTGPQLHGLFDYMIALTQRQQFMPSEAALQHMTFPDEWFSVLRPHSDFGQNLPKALSECRAESIKTCRMAREQAQYLDHNARNQAVKQALQVNKAWQRLKVEF